MGALCSFSSTGHEAGEYAPVPEPSGAHKYAAAVALCKMGCGCQVQPGMYKGRPFDTCCRSCAVSPGAGVHSEDCPGPPARGGVVWDGGLTNEGESSASRPVCPKGARCKQRTPEHLAAEAHPLDKDYRASCEAAGRPPEEPSLKLLFDWADADGSGKLTKEELGATLHIINMLSGTIDAEDNPELSPDAWKRLDEDGNGLINFNEFACWAGPRLGLPLGVRKMIDRAGTVDVKARPCGVYNCPCEKYESAHVSLHCNNCKHKSSSHVTKTYSGEVPFPEYWDLDDDHPHKLVDMQGMAQTEFQELLDKTYKKAWTRDRSKHNENKKVPTGFKVTAVFRNENCDNWKEYCVRRAELFTRIQEDSQEGREAIEVVDDVKTVVAWRGISSHKADRLSSECNEWYLFHGTNPTAAKSICSSDFKLSFAGDNTGTLYGRGLYFAESITKSDEYAKPSPDGTYAVLLCRILGGRVKYSDEVSPDVEDLVHSVTEGPYDTILGDREKCRGTYREFVIFDTEDVYPEYLIEYKRVY